jgi:hypothetical protein
MTITEPRRRGKLRRCWKIWCEVLQLKRWNRVKTLKSTAVLFQRDLGTIALAGIG